MDIIDACPPRAMLDARRIGLVFASGLGLGMAVCVAWAVPASADSVADLNRPSSTSPGCVNTWNPT